MTKKNNPKTDDTNSEKKLAETAAETDHKATIGRTVWDVLIGFSAIILKYPAMSAVIMLLLTTAALGIAWSNGIKISRDKDGNTTVDVGAGTNPLSKNDPKTGNKVVDVDEMVRKGKEKRLPYIILSITDINRLELEILNGERKLMLRRSITYVIRSLRKIEKTDNVFIEQYWSSETKPERIPGTEEEVGQTGGKWAVEIEMEEGETRTITTGAVFPYSLPLENNRLALGEQIHPTSDEQFLSYPNESDFVGEIVMKIESVSLNLVPVGVKAARRYNKDEGKFLCGNIVQQNTMGIAKMTSLSSRWLNVNPNQEVGIHFRMENLNLPLATAPAKGKRRSKG
jgi:hypothetical protein